MWGSWMTVLIFATGLYLSVKFKFSYITKIKFHFKNTVGKMFSKGDEGEGTISGFAAACTGLANTIGTGTELLIKCQRLPRGFFWNRGLPALVYSMDKVEM